MTLEWFDKRICGRCGRRMDLIKAESELSFDEPTVHGTTVVKHWYWRCPDCANIVPYEEAERDEIQV